MNYFLHPSKESTLSKKSLIEKGILEGSDFKILESELLKKSLSRNLAEKENTEISYLLIKKRYPHFDQEQILAHYQLLQNFCGL